MKSKILSIIISLGLLVSCEVYLPDPGIELKDEVKIAASALVIAGDTVKVRLAHTESLQEPASEVYTDRAMLLRALMFSDTTYHYTDKYLMQKYYDELILRVGKVELITGDGETLEMKFNPANFDFECAHKAIPGERLRFSAEVTSRDGKNLKVTSSTTVPGWKPEAEIIEVTRQYKERLKREDLDMREMTQDSVYQFKIHIKDSSKDLHCYRIRVRGVTYNYKGEYVFDFSSTSHTVKDYMRWTDAFFSNDPLLYDAGIVSGFGAWQPYTTDVFSNRDFNGDDYVLTVQSRYPYYFIGNHRFFEIHLQPISSDLMNYLSTLYRVRTSKTNYFSEPMSISSNINGGVGVFGSMGESLCIRFFLPGEEDPDYPNPPAIRFPEW